MFQAEVLAIPEVATGPALWGHFGTVPPQMTACAPPKRKLCPPKRGLCPEESNRLGATGEQIEA